jgi:hypothetical protein
LFSSLSVDSAPIALVIAGGCSNKSSPPPKLGYSTALKELRNRFNKDKGKVRMLLILSPT